ncbi:MAG: hypothetical protein R3A13_10385 [Bdellovibrionota bacterium]
MPQHAIRLREAPSQPAPTIDQTLISRGNLRIELETIRKDKFQQGALQRIAFKLMRGSNPLYSLEIQADAAAKDSKSSTSERILSLFVDLEQHLSQQKDQEDSAASSAKTRELIRSIHRLARLQPYTMKQSSPVPLANFDKAELIALWELDLYLAPPNRRLDTLTCLPPTESLFRKENQKAFHTQCKNNGFFTIYMDRQYMGIADRAGLGETVNQALKGMSQAAANALTPLIQQLGLSGIDSGLDTVLNGLCRAGGDEFVLVIPNYPGAKEHIQEFLKQLDLMREEHFSYAALSQTEAGQEVLRQAKFKAALRKQLSQIKDPQSVLDSFKDLLPDDNEAALILALQHLTQTEVSMNGNSQQDPGIMRNSISMLEVAGLEAHGPEISDKDLEKTLAASIVYCRDHLKKGRQTEPLRVTPSDLVDKLCEQAHLKSFLARIHRLQAIEVAFDQVIEKLRSDQISLKDAIKQLTCMAGCDPTCNLSPENSKTVLRANYSAHMLLSDLFASEKTPKKLYILEIDKENFGIENDPLLGGEENGNQVFSQMAEVFTSKLKFKKRFPMVSECKTIFIRVNGGGLLCVSETKPNPTEIKAALAEALQTYKELDSETRKVNHSFLRASKRALERAQRPVGKIAPTVTRTVYFDFGLTTSTKPIATQNNWKVIHLIDAWRKAKDKITAKA